MNCGFGGKRNYKKLTNRVKKEMKNKKDGIKSGYVFLWFILRLYERKEGELPERARGANSAGASPRLQAVGGG